ncbi:MAG: hypothetical protein FGM24_04375 [Candidatus Kapabacteria bacterium]|nr:hypothetical protein [Candidatus Kapabacteria bacterium]
MDASPITTVHIVQAVYYTLVLVVAIAGVHRLAIRAADRMQQNIVKSSAEVIKAAVLQESRHADHERRLDDVERMMRVAVQSHESLVEHVTSGFAEVKELMRDHQSRVDKLFAMAAQSPPRKGM